MERTERQAENAASGIVQAVQDFGRDASSAVQESYEDLRDGASGYVRQGREFAENWKKTLEKHVKDQPVQSLMIALGLGLAIGYLYRRL